MRLSCFASRTTVHVCTAIVALLPALPGYGATEPSALCLAAAADAAQQEGVPYNVLLALTLVETGQRRDGEFRPWPWTVNEGGEGQWFATKAEAETHAQAALDQGATNVDLGCFQLNYRWHAENFGSLEEMLDPGMNAAYAARFLAQLYADTGSWSDAAAAYHSRTPEYAAIYRDKFDGVLAALDGGGGDGGGPALVAAAEPVERVNRFPLLIGGRGGTNGSLVPASQGAVRLIGGP